MSEERPFWSIAVHTESASLRWSTAICYRLCDLLCGIESEAYAATTLMWRQAAIR